MLDAICTKCGTPFTYERVRGGRKNCDSCSRRKTGERYRRKHAERVRASQRKWRAANPEKAQVATRSWVERNGDYVRGRNRERWADPVERAKLEAGYRRWLERNRETVNARVLQWQRDNPDRVRARTLRRRARLAGAEVSDFTAAEWDELLVEHDHRCFYCGERHDRLEREHVIPLSRGGDHTKANIVPACGPCNRRKWTLTGDEFNERMGSSAGQG